MFESQFVEERLIPPSEIVDYINARRLGWKTKIKGPLEFAIKKVLLNHNPPIESYYHIFPFTTDDLTWHIPDFLLPQIKLNGKFLILNPHHFRMDCENNVVNSDIVRWTGFQRLWGHQFHNIIISSYGEKELVKQVGAKDVYDFANDSWKVPNHGAYSNEIIPVIRRKLSEVFRGNAVSYDKTCPMAELVCCLQRAQRIRDLQMEFVSTNDRLIAKNKCPSIS